jgi:hypothetical protein
VGGACGGGGLVVLFAWDVMLFMRVSTLVIALVFVVLLRTAWALPRPEGAYSTRVLGAVFAVQAVIYGLLSFQGITYPFDPDTLTDWSAPPASCPCCLPW